MGLSLVQYNLIEGFAKGILFPRICLLFVLKVFQLCFDRLRFRGLFMAIRLVGGLQIFHISFLLMIVFSSMRQRRKNVLL